MIELLIFLLVLILVIYIAQWVIGLLNLPAPANRIALVIIAIIALVVLLDRLGLYHFR